MKYKLSNINNTDDDDDDDNRNDIDRHTEIKSKSRYRDEITFVWSYLDPSQTRVVKHNK